MGFVEPNFQNHPGWSYVHIICMVTILSDLEAGFGCKCAQISMVFMPDNNNRGCLWRLFHRGKIYLEMRVIGTTNHDKSQDYVPFTTRASASAKQCPVGEF